MNPAHRSSGQVLTDLKASIVEASGWLTRFTLLVEELDTAENRQRRIAAAKGTRSRRAQGEEVRARVVGQLARLIAMEVPDAVAITAVRCGLSERHVRRLARETNPPDASEVGGVLTPPTTRNRHGHQDR